MRSRGQDFGLQLQTVVGSKLLLRGSRPLLRGSKLLQGPDCYPEGPKRYREGPKCYREGTAIKFSISVSHIVFVTLNSSRRYLDLLYSLLLTGLLVLFVET